ncbi:hypothetical protein QCF01_15905, partial [Staphylococcus aureus]|nr:hypothetical protein [Staphylococcus aureus]
RMQSINKMVTAAIAAIVLLVLASGAGSVWSNGRQAAARQGITQGSSLLRNHMTADMMHDSVRGDVFSVLRAANIGDLNLADSRKSLADDTALLRKSVLADASYAAAPEVMAQAKRIQPLVDDYIATAQHISDAAVNDRARASSLLPPFLAAFQKLERGMSDLSDLIEAHLADVGQEASRVAMMANILLAVTTFSTFALVMAIGFASRRYIVAPLLT